MKKLIALAVAGIWYAGLEPPPVVALHKVSRGMVERTVSNTRAGTVDACRRSKLSMPIGGRVDELHVDEGDKVEAGQVLLSLWNKDRRAMTAQAEAQLLVARHGALSLHARDLNGQRLGATFKVELICIVDAVDRGTLVMRNEKRNLMLPSSRLLHWAKRGFEWNYLRQYR